jgi:hypothetical protein
MQHEISRTRVVYSNSIEVKVSDSSLYGKFVTVQPSSLSSRLGENLLLILAPLLQQGGRKSNNSFSM